MNTGSSARMMTNPPAPFRGRAGRPTRSRAFTLVEIIITMFIVMLLIGLSVLSIQAVSHERELREVTATIKDFAKKARAQAMIEQRPYQIEFRAGGISVSALQQPDEEDPYARLVAVEDTAAEVVELQRFVLPDGVRVDLRRWGARDYLPPEEPRYWLFEQGGICEPVDVRVTSPHGYIEMAFNPLTANVDDEMSEIE